MFEEASYQNISKVSNRYIGKLTEDRGSAKYLNDKQLVERLGEQLGFNEIAIKR